MEDNMPVKGWSASGGKKTIIIIIIILAIIVATVVFINFKYPLLLKCSYSICSYGYDIKKDSTVANFTECIDAGNPAMESYPRQCRTQSGETFVEDIGNELEKTDLIRIDYPRPNQKISSPLIIDGQARGYWFFEGDFPVKLLASNGDELAVGIATARGEWMTDDFISFSADLEFDPSLIGSGMLILEKDNPSGLLENADQLEVPVVFEQ